MQPTKKEQAAIAELEALAKRWPKSLWIFCNGMNVYILKKDANGKHAICSSGGVDPAYVVGTVDIDNDGGDW